MFSRILPVVGVLALSSSCRPPFINVSRSKTVGIMQKYSKGGLTPASSGKRLLRKFLSAFLASFQTALRAACTQTWSKSILDRATDNFLLATSDSAHEYIVSVLCHKTNGSVRWLIHDYGLAKYYFGIRIVQSADVVSLDQRLYACDVLVSVLFGAS